MPKEQAMQDINEINEEAPGPEATSTTPYDEVFKTMVYDCRSLLPMVLNELFGERYTGDEAVEFRQNELVITTPGGEQVRRLPDSHFSVLGVVRRGYIFECETEMDGSILARVFQYGSESALRGAETENGVLTVNFPRIAILVLRGGKRARRRMTVRLVLPNDEAAAFEVPLMYVSDYALEEIFEKKLLFLLPFYLFTHERRLDLYERDAAAMDGLLKDFREIMGRLARLQEDGVLDGYTKDTIETMLRKVVQHLAAKYPKVKKGLMEIMGGTTLIAHDAWKIRREGLIEGERKGERKGLLATARQLLLMGVLPLKQIAQATGLSISELEAMKDEVSRKQA